MIPNIAILEEEITDIEYGNKTYKLDFKSNRIDGFTDELDAIKQTIYIILSSERFEHNIYSWDYGVELVDLYGKPLPYVISELKRRITEALTQDDRIDTVTDFEFTKNGKRLYTTFTVVTTKGNIPTDLEVEV